MTKGEAKAAALRWIDEATVNGRDPGIGELADYRDRMDHLLDGVLNALAVSFPLSGVQSIVHYPPENLLGNTAQVQQITSPQGVVLQASGAKSMYAEICGGARVCFADGQVTEVPNTGAFEAVRALLANDKPITVKSENPFLMRNAALYARSYDGVEQIPPYAIHNAYALPTDLRALRRVVREHDGQSTAFSEYRCEDGRNLLLPRTQCGVFWVYYDRRPQKTAHNAEDTFELDCHPIAEPLIPLKLAADVTLGTADRAQTAYYLENRYTAMLLTLQAERPNAQVHIESVYTVN